MIHKCGLFVRIIHLPLCCKSSREKCSIYVFACSSEMSAIHWTFSDENGRAYPDYLVRYYKGKRDPTRTPYGSKAEVPQITEVILPDRDHLPTRDEKFVSIRDIEPEPETARP